MRSFVILCALLASGAAVAGGNQGPAGNSGDGSSNSLDAAISVGSFNANSNTNQQSQGQTQSQGQSQTAKGGSAYSGSSSTVKDSGNSASVSSSRGGSVKGSGNSTNTNSVGPSSATVTEAPVSDAANGNGDGSNNTSLQQTYQAARIPAATAYAANLTSGLDTCLGSMSGGAQAQWFGLSLGGTKVDKNCVLIKQAQLLSEMGLKRSACERARMDRNIARAMDDAGERCPDSAKQAVSVTQFQQALEHLQQLLATDASKADLAAAIAQVNANMATVEQRITQRITAK